MRRNLARIVAIARRDFYIEGSYRLRYLNRLVEVGITGIILFQLSKIVVDAPALEEFGGGYFEFALIGFCILTIARLGISAFNSNIQTEATNGTLEILLVTPTRVSVLLAGSFSSLALTMIDLVLYGLGMAIFGDGLRPIGLLWVIPLLGLTLASFCAFGVMGASLVMLTKRGDPLTAPITALTSILSGALFPLSTFPFALQVVARIFPAYYGINGLREALLSDSGWLDVGADLLVLAAFDAVLLPLSVAMFSRSLSAARRTGTLSNY